MDEEAGGLEAHSAAQDLAASMEGLSSGWGEAPASAFPAVVETWSRTGDSNFRGELADHQADHQADATEIQIDVNVEEGVRKQILQSMVTSWPWAPPDLARDPEHFTSANVRSTTERTNQLDGDTLNDLKLAFDACDIDGSNSIDHQELLAVLHALGADLELDQVKVRL